ncbi:hypothetical protein [Kineococcus gypseus]|uniref:hypothetical protein n=1 Tax=Kineococcus gypseus TaxID=1637102 RepID=UPI003D7C4ECE
MSRSGDTPATSRAPARRSSADHATKRAAGTPADTTPVAERAQVRALAEQEARDVLTAHAAEPDSEKLQRVRDLLTETENELEQAWQRAHAAAFSLAFYDGAAPLANRYLQISRPSWMVRRRQALDVQGPWLSSASPEQVRQRALERGIAHDPQAMLTLPALAAELIMLEERVRALRELRKELVRQVYRANPATMVNPEGLSQSLLAQWSGLTPGRISQLISQSYRAKPPSADPDHAIPQSMSADSPGEHAGAGGDQQDEDN